MRINRALGALALATVLVIDAVPASASGISSSCAGMRYLIETYGASASHMHSNGQGGLLIPYIKAGSEYRAPTAGTPLTWTYSTPAYTYDAYSPATLTRRTRIRGWQQTPLEPVQSCYTPYFVTP